MTTLVPSQCPGDRTLIAQRPYTTNARDAHLILVLARGGADYVTWVYNAQDGGFHFGEYSNSHAYGGSLDTALNAGVASFYSRGDAATPVTILATATAHERETIREWRA